jgi:serine/threonine-protein kinase
VSSVNVDPYCIERRIAEGGMGVVYQAVHSVLGRPVALKVLHPHVAALPDAVDRFRREAQALATIEHPHAVRVFDFVVKPSPFLVMEYVEGQSMDQALAEWGPLPFDEVCAIASQVLEVLEVVHQRGIVHRDLKPANLMLDARQPVQPFVKVVDFGVALLTGPTHARLTAEGQAVGTPDFMSPEQINAEPLDARSDLYSLACVLFELLTGRAPFSDQPSPVHILSAHLFREPPRFEELGVASVPPAWQAALRKALSKPRDARFASAKEMRLALEAARDERARGKEPRLAGARPMEFVAAEFGDPPVALVLGEGARAEDRELIERALAGVGALVAREVAGAGAAIILAGDGERALRELTKVREQARELPVLLCGGEQEFAVMTRSLEQGAFDYLPMPLESSDIGRKAVRALRARKTS